MSAVLSSTENYISSFDIDIFYCQIAVFQAGLKNPFNDWTETHVQQGFSWRAESVSFGTLDESGKAAVYITIPKNLILKPNTIRAIKVPFTVPQNGLVEIGSVTETQTVEIDSGTYELLFETD